MPSPRDKKGRRNILPPHMKTKKGEELRLDLTDDERAADEPAVLCELCGRPEEDRAWRRREGVDTVSDPVGEPAAAAG